MSPAAVGGVGRGGHRRGLVLAAVATALLLLVVAVTLHMRLGGSAAGGPAPQPPGIGQPSATSSDTSSATASPDDPAMSMEGAEVTWSRLCGVDLPYSDVHGPHSGDGQRQYGFARDAGGAVVAAAHLLVQISPQTGPEVFAATVSEQVVGPDADALGHAVHDQYTQLAEAAQLPYGEPACPIYARVVGFVVDSHSAHAASLRLLVEGPSSDGAPQWASLLVQLSWVDGDWRLVAPPLGDWSRVSTLLPASATDLFTPLGPGV